MPAFFIELFANAKLTYAFWTLWVFDAPLWILMLLFPGKKWVQKLCSPYFLPVILNGVLFYFYYLTITVGPPELPQGIDFRQSKAFIAHPLVILVLWCHLRILHLLLGCIIFREAYRHKTQTPFILLLTWLLGPVGWGVFALKMMLVKRS